MPEYDDVERINKCEDNESHQRSREKRRPEYPHQRTPLHALFSPESGGVDLGRLLGDYQTSLDPTIMNFLIAEILHSEVNCDGTTNDGQERPCHEYPGPGFTIPGLYFLCLFHITRLYITFPRPVWCKPDVLILIGNIETRAFLDLHLAPAFSIPFCLKFNIMQPG